MKSVREFSQKKSLNNKEIKKISNRNKHTLRLCLEGGQHLFNIVLKTPERRKRVNKIN